MQKKTMAKQAIVIVNTDTSSLLSNTPITFKLLTGVFGFDGIQDLPCKTDTSSSYLSWNITNKYYTADVDVCGVNSKKVFDETFSDHVQAIIAIFSSKKADEGLEHLKSWLPFFEVLQPQIKLAVCEKCSSSSTDDTYILREDMQRWCIKNAFELVEMNPDEEDFDEYEDYGVKRIKDALSAITWPVMTFKQDGNNSNVNNLLKENASEIPNSYDTVEKRIDKLLEKPDSDELDESDFESLFQKMHLIKQTAESLPQESRKVYAEKVVVAFWKALNGDKEEISGLSSDDDLG